MSKTVEDLSGFLGSIRRTLPARSATRSVPSAAPSTTVGASRSVVIASALTELSGIEDGAVVSTEPDLSVSVSASVHPNSTALHATTTVRAPIRREFIGCAYSSRSVGSVPVSGTVTVRAEPSRFATMRLM